MTKAFAHQIVTALPDKLSEGVLYISADMDLVAHRCACGCGREVVTPLSPTGWRLTLDQRGATLRPSVGNWSFPCRSHYLVTAGRVQWAGDMSAEEIECGRARDQTRKAKYYAARKTTNAGVGIGADAPASPVRMPWWRRLWAWLFSRL